MKPSNYTKLPMGSVSRNSETETVARNIMIILSRTGDEWRCLTWEEYETERRKDGGFSTAEREYFDRVIDYCVSAQTADLFCKHWAT